MNAAFVRNRLRRFKAMQEPLAVERRIQTVAGALLRRDRRRLLARDVALAHCEAVLLSSGPSKSAGAVLYLHGGGYCCGDLTYACGFGSVIAAETGADTLCVAYRLAPEDPFPAAVEDALDGYRHLLAGYPAQRIALIGESAGGGLIYALCLRCKALGLPLPGGLVAISPWVDLTQSGPSYEENRDADPSMTRARLDRYAAAYAPDPADRLDPLCSPLFGDLSGLPESRVYVGGDEVMKSDAVGLCEKLRRDGSLARLTVAEGMWHGYVLYDLEECQADKRAVAAFLREVTR